MISRVVTVAEFSTYAFCPIPAVEISRAGHSSQWSWWLSQLVTAVTAVTGNTKCLSRVAGLQIGEWIALAENHALVT